MTYLTVKALRHYHDVGVLTPADIDPASGYRLYSTDQVQTALLISRFRDLDMPLDDVRLLLDTSDIDARNAIIVAHLQRMEDRLDRTRVAVDSLRAMLSMDAPAPIVIRYRVMSPMLVLAVTETVAGDDFGDWLQGVWTELDNVVRRSAHSASGPNGALYEAAFFEESCGPVTAFVPIAGECAGSGRVTMATLPAVTYAITDHRGGFDGIDRTYGALGTAVAELRIGAPGPIREIYPADDLTEVCWPITAAP